jgi:hypothetical protein
VAVIKLLVLADDFPVFLRRKGREWKRSTPKFDRASICAQATWVCKLVLQALVLNMCNRCYLLLASLVNMSPTCARV